MRSWSPWFALLVRDRKVGLHVENGSCTYQYNPKTQAFHELPRQSVNDGYGFMLLT